MESINDIKLRTELPEGFPIQAFNENLIITFSTLADFPIDDWGIMKIIFLNHVSKAFVTSSYFNELSEDSKVEAMNNMNSLRYILELLADLFTDSIYDNSYQISKYLERKLS